MTVEEKVQAILIADAGVTALVPQERVKISGDWQGLARPYIVHHPAGGEEPLHMHSGIANYKKWPYYQISCFADSYSGAKAVAMAVKAALGDYRSGKIQSFWAGQMPDQFESDTRVHHIPCHLEIHDFIGDVIGA